MKYVIIIGDGMSDFPVASLGGKTPLMVAKKPNIDKIARDGRTGQMETIPPELPTGSDVANLSVLGYDPRLCQGRGVIEAVSIGVNLSEDEVAMRCNLICIENERVKNHSAGHISNEEGHKLIHFLNENLSSQRIRFYPGVSYRHLLVIKDASAKLETFPPHDNVGANVEEVMIKGASPDAFQTAQEVAELVKKSWALLENHPVNVARKTSGKDPANSIWPWSPGKKPKMKTFQERFGISAAVISAVDLIKGLGIYAGMDIIEVKGATGLSDTNYEGKARAALEALRNHDLVYVHVEATDEAGHSRDLGLKIRCIEYLDDRLVRPIFNGIETLGLEASIAILPDHPTPVEHGNHARALVPVAIWTSGKEGDSIDRFDEESVVKGSLGLMKGDKFIKTLLNLETV
ncbi:cofactor-independent phosphoglycerate mutase [bacterium]|nr:cofactor-independent phosphoglycerate mutase [bacterium]